MRMWLVSCHMPNSSRLALVLYLFTVVPASVLAQTAQTAASASRRLPDSLGLVFGWPPCAHRICASKRRTISRSEGPQSELDSLVAYASSHGLLDLPSDIRHDERM